MVLINITPDKQLMPKLGAAWYTIPEAIAELIDNAIDARSDDDMEISIKTFPDKITIADRGIGMDFEQIKNSIILAKSSKKWKLWQFWLWLKTSCLSLWNNFKVISKKIWEDKEYKIEFDKEKWLENDRRELDVQERKIYKEAHYTIIEVSDLKVKILQSLEDKLIEDIQMRFSHFLKEIPIKVNNKVVKQLSPEIEEWSRMEINHKSEYGTITGRVWLLLKGSLQWKYWIHTYKDNRLIMPYNKIWFTAHPTVARIYWEVNADFVPVTNNKKSFQTATPEYKDLEDTLTNILRPVLVKAREAKSKELQTANVIKNTEVWNKETSQAVNQIVSQIQNQTPVSLPKQDIVKADQDISTPHTDSKKINEVLKTISWDKHKNFEINFAGQRLSFTHSFENLGAEQGWKVWKYDSKVQTINIYTNADFPVYYACNDLPFLATIHIAESLTEFILSGKKNEDSLASFREIFVAILRIASNMKEEL